MDPSYDFEGSQLISLGHPKKLSFVKCLLPFDPEEHEDQSIAWQMNLTLDKTEKLVLRDLDIQETEAESFS